MRIMPLSLLRSAKFAQNVNFRQNLDSQKPLSNSKISINSRRQQVASKYKSYRFEELLSDFSSGSQLITQIQAQASEHRFHILIVQETASIRQFFIDCRCDFAGIHGFEYGHQHTSCFQSHPFVRMPQQDLAIFCWQRISRNIIRV